MYLSTPPAWCTSTVPTRQHNAVEVRRGVYRPFALECHRVWTCVGTPVFFNLERPSRGQSAPLGDLLSAATCLGVLGHVADMEDHFMQRYTFGLLVTRASAWVSCRGYAHRLGEVQCLDRDF